MNDKIDDLNLHGNGSPLVWSSDAVHEDLRSRFTLSENEISQTLSNGSDLAPASKETMNDLSSQKKEDGPPPQRDLLMGRNAGIVIGRAKHVLDCNHRITCSCCARLRDARPCLDKVSYALLVFFCGMFITVYGFNTTGIRNRLWELMEPYARIDRASGVAALAAVILVLCNVASNVPTGDRQNLTTLAGITGGRVSCCDISRQRKEVVAYISMDKHRGRELVPTRLTANLIVCEQARCAPYPIGYTLSFWSHLKFGVPSTILVTAIGLLLIR
ncbi:hypothetical protein MLD38_025678 [Melastoma candidum]|uniref:Uncharacterized protein n=1 Tax=Melastoma candidum TaxID=119954 RepID=A0ACB9NWK5_9MYRT|nr:hypothetical protein MLD38_025678 [Melastoma candidum]